MGVGGDSRSAEPVAAQDLFPTMLILAALPEKTRAYALRQFSGGRSAAVPWNPEKSPNRGSGSRTPAIQTEERERRRSGRPESGTVSSGGAHWRFSGVTVQTAAERGSVRSENVQRPGEDLSGFTGLPNR